MNHSVHQKFAKFWMVFKNVLPRSIVFSVTIKWFSKRFHRNWFNFPYAFNLFRALVMHRLFYSKLISSHIHSIKGKHEFKSLISIFFRQITFRDFFGVVSLLIKLGLNTRLKYFLSINRLSRCNRRFLLCSWCLYVFVVDVVIITTSWLFSTACPHLWMLFCINNSYQL